MKDLNKYKGVVPAFYACYNAQGEVCPQRVQALTRHLLEKGVKGLYVGGSSGECIYQSVDERKLVLENVMQAAEGRLTVIAHVACNNTRDSAELARHAEALGADAIAAIPPIYFHLPQHAIAQYWNTISESAPGTDFIIYNIPQLAGVSLTLPLLREMLKNPRVIAVKNSSMPVQDIQAFMAEGSQSGNEFLVFNGPDEQLVSGLVMGAAGGIGGTYGAYPELVLKLFDLVAQRELEQARKLQYDINGIISAMCATTGSMYATIKEILRRREGLDIGGVREPQFNLTEDDMPIVTRCVAMIDEAIRQWA